jgi:hypothetical protein
VIDHYTGAKRKAFEEAYESLKLNHLTKEDGKVRMFIKADKSHDRECKAPRAIQFRSKRYGLTWARYVHPIEQALYPYKDWTGTRVCAKGRNGLQRANDLLKKSQAFSEPLFLCLDHSKFDAHITTELLQAEHTFYKGLFNRPNRKAVDYLCSMQYLNQGTTKNGTRYSTPGTRMSGDQSTALGNTVVNLLVLSSWLSGHKHSVYVDGDDSVVIVEAQDKTIPDMHVSMNEMCMETKEDQRTQNFEEVEFCQCRPVETPTGWLMVRNPFRAMARMGWNVINLPEKARQRWIKSVGMCELAMGSGIPIVQAAALAMMRAGSGEYLVTDRHYQANLMRRPTKAVPSPIHPSTRASFARAWGLSPAEQMALEASLTVTTTGRDAYSVDEHPYDRTAY